MRGQTSGQQSTGLPKLSALRHATRTHSRRRFLSCRVLGIENECACSPNCPRPPKPAQIDGLEVRRTFRIDGLDVRRTVEIDGLDVRRTCRGAAATIRARTL